MWTTGTLMVRKTDSRLESLCLDDEDDDDDEDGIVWIQEGEVEEEEELD